MRQDTDTIEVHGAGEVNAVLLQTTHPSWNKEIPPKLVYLF